MILLEVSFSSCGANTTFKFRSWHCFDYPQPEHNSASAAHYMANLAIKKSHFPFFESLDLTKLICSIIESQTADGLCLVCECAFKGWLSTFLYFYFQIGSEIKYQLLRYIHWVSRYVSTFQSLSSCRQTQQYRWIFIHICTYICICWYMCVYIYIYVYMYLYTYIYKYI